ncbi:MAG: TIGR04282 family arsenosugar biosynthesis glycosyltransferase [Bryobacterales bacterium]|nr:TIGR04282 family arsenosugar biosynthesis glycosyltransferase [Bryobacterales bacterium]
MALFAKAAHPGRVKTRLGPALTLELAAEFHALCTEHLWRRFAADRRLDTFLYCDDQWPPFERLARDGRLRIQQGCDLGARMLNCLRELLGEGHPKALIVGSDAPTLPASQLDEALVALDRHQVVLGPSIDGGFTLIGATRTRPGIFAGVRWSRDNTREACLKAIADTGLGARVTPTSAFDVDTPSDLVRLAADPALPPSLGDWLRRCGPEAAVQAGFMGGRS